MYPKKNDINGNNKEIKISVFGKSIDILFAIKKREPLIIPIGLERKIRKKNKKVADKSLEAFLLDSMTKRMYGSIKKVAVSRSIQDLCELLIPRTKDKNAGRIFRFIPEGLIKCIANKRNKITNNFISDNFHVSMINAMENGIANLNFANLGKLMIVEMMTKIFRKCLIKVIYINGIFIEK